MCWPSTVPCRPSRTRRTSATASPILTYGSGSPSWIAAFHWSSAAGANSSWHPSNAPGPLGVAALSSRSSVKPCCGYCPTTDGPRLRPSEMVEPSEQPRNRPGRRGPRACRPTRPLSRLDQVLENAPFGRHEYGSLVRAMLAVPGADPKIPLVAVSRCGVTDGLPLAAHWGPKTCWAPGSREVNGPEHPLCRPRAGT